MNALFMNALSSRVVIIAVAALLGASANGRDAQAQSYFVNGVTFSANVQDWTISAAAAHGEFTPVIDYTSVYHAFNKDGADCCASDSLCYFKREDTKPPQTISASGVTAGTTITGTQALTGFIAKDGQTTRYAISLIAMCSLVLNPNPSQLVTWHLPGWRTLRPDRFTLTVNP
jgi:hypothetical protein